MLCIMDGDANNWVPGLCATPSPIGATAGGTRHRRSPSPRTIDDAGDGRAPPAQAMSARGRRGKRDTPPSGAGPPDPHAPIVRRSEGARATSSRGEDGGNEREGRTIAPQPAKH